MSALIEHEAVTDVPAFHGHQTSTSALVLDDGSIDRMMRVAEIMASGKATVPQHLRNNPGDCLAVVMQAMQWRMNPFAVAQKTHLVNGTLGYEAQLVNAVVSSSPLLHTRISYSWGGDWSKCSGKNDKSSLLTATVSATIRGETEPRVLTISMAQAGVRNSPNWEHDPKQQLAYLCTKRWARLHAPDVLLGVYTPDELDQGTPAERDITPRANSAPVAAAPATRTAQLKQRLAAKPAPAALPAPSLDDVLLAISTAGGRAQMQAAKEMAGQLGEQDYAVAVKRYQQRVDELRAQAAPAAAAGAPGFDLDGFKTRIGNCKDVDTLDLMADEFSGIADGEAFQQLSDLYHARRAELLGD
ncbi:RecT family recombinase [Chromobacterium haemolyticum]|uniref:RecT family recombinase n=1 Tax=Chromobacterium haemolyticum TaxID=394935 RepID=UPI0009DFFE8D|nr:RecT family recombinase [Chromobacterium haemolyticum]